MLVPVTLCIYDAYVCRLNELTENTVFPTKIRSKNESG